MQKSVLEAGASVFERQLAQTQEELRQAKIDAAVREEKLATDNVMLKAKLEHALYDNENLLAMIEAVEGENIALKAQVELVETKLAAARNMAARSIQAARSGQQSLPVRPAVSGKTIAMLRASKASTDTLVRDDDDAEEDSDEESEEVAPYTGPLCAKAPAHLFTESLNEILDRAMPAETLVEQSIFAPPNEDLSPLSDFGGLEPEMSAAPALTVRQLLGGFKDCPSFLKIKFFSVDERDWALFARSGITHTNHNIPALLVVNEIGGVPNFDAVKYLNKRDGRRFEEHEIPVTTDLELAHARFALGESADSARLLSMVRKWRYTADPDLEFAASFNEVARSSEDSFGLALRPNENGEVEETVVAQGRVVSETVVAQGRVVSETPKKRLVDLTLDSDDDLAEDVMAMDDCHVNKRARPTTLADDEEEEEELVRGADELDNNHNVIDILSGIPRRHFNLVNVRFMEFSDEFLGEWKDLFERVGVNAKGTLVKKSSLIVVPVDRYNKPMLETVFEKNDAMHLACQANKGRQGPIRVTTVVELARGLRRFDAGGASVFSRELEERFTATVRTWTWRKARFTEPRVFHNGTDATHAYWTNLRTLCGQCVPDSGTMPSTPEELASFLRKQFVNN